jgi:hypothetical protein
MQAHNACMQYTLREIPSALDRALRQRAKREGKSLNRVAVELLSEAAGVTAAKRKRRSLDDLAGTWAKDAATDEALQAQRGIDKGLWR